MRAGKGARKLQESTTLGKAQQRPIQSAKEPYSKPKRALFEAQKSPIQSAKQPYSKHKRALVTLAYLRYANVTRALSPYDRSLFPCVLYSIHHMHAHTV